MLAAYLMAAYHKHLDSLSDNDLDKEKESCENSQEDDPWYLAACYSEQKRRKELRELAHQMR